MNVKLLRKVKKHILAEPKRFYMPWFILRKRDGDDIPRQYPSCGTVGCIAGWTCLISSGMEFKGDEFSEAQKLLQLSKAEAIRLFSMYAAPTKYNLMYNEDGKKKTAEVAAARIEHFIKTKGRE